MDYRPPSTATIWPVTHDAAGAHEDSAAAPAARLPGHLIVRCFGSWGQFAGLMTEEGMTINGKRSGILFATRTAEHIDRRANLTIDKAGLAQHFAPACTRQATGDSSRPQVNVSNRLLGDFVSVGDIGKLQPATRLEHTEYLVENSLLIDA